MKGFTSRSDDTEDWLGRQGNRTYIIGKAKRKSQKKWEKIKGSLGQHQVCQHSHHRGTRKRETQEIEKIFEKIMTENFPNLVEKNRHTSPGRTKTSKTRVTQMGPHQDKS